MKGLVHHIYSLSPQVKLILGTRTIRSNSVCLYIFHVFKFLSSYVIPPFMALIAAYLYYYADSTPIIVDTESNATNSTEWHIDPVGAGNWAGDGIRTLISVPLQFLATTIDRIFHLSEVMNTVQSTGSRLFYTPFVAIGVYILTHLLLQCFLNVQMLMSKQWALWSYQDLFLKETAEAIERSVTSILRPQLIYTMEQYLVNSSNSKELVPQSRITLEHVYHTYKDDVDLLRETMLEQAFTYIRSIPLAEHLVQGRISEQYLKGLRMLIRHADEELSTILFQLNQEINRFPSEVGNRVATTGRVAFHQLARLTNLY